MTARDYQFIALAVLVFIAICYGLVRSNLTLKGGGDFYVHWVAARAFLFDNVDPYGAEVPNRVQKLVYENGAQTGDEPYIFDTPFQLLQLYYPFALFTDPQLVRAIFTLLLELAFYLLIVLSLQLTDWEPPISYTVLFVFMAAFNFYTYQAIREANPVLILGLIYAGILFSIRADLDEVTGALMAFSLYYWEVGGPFLVLIVLRMYFEKRQRVLAGFFMAGFILVFISFLSYPNWIIPFLRATVNNLRADFGHNLFTIFIYIFPEQGRTYALVFTLLLMIALGYEWSIARGSEYRRFYWAACLSLAAAPLLGFRTEMEHLAILIIPWALILSIVYDRWRRFGGVLVILLMLLLLIIPWTLQLFAVARWGAIVHEMIFIFLPLSTLVGLYWIRWWAIRPPRILSDIANRL